MDNQELAVGVDIGGTKIASILVNQKGSILASDYRMSAVEMGQEETIDRVVASIQAVTGTHQNISGIGIDVPGVVNPETGLVEKAVNLGWDNVDLRGKLQQKLALHCPISLERDTFAQALGEYYYGSACGEKNYVYLAVGSGLGAGALVNGQLLLGSGRAALEVGHLSLTGLTAQCSCGNTGCAETLLSGPGIIRTYLCDSWYEECPAAVADREALSVQDILQRALENEPRASHLITEAARYLGELIADIIMVLNPSQIVIGGGVGLSAFDQLLPGVQAEVVRRTFPENHRNLQITKSSIDSSALGAAALVWYSQHIAQ
jgi:glucokinase